MGQFYKFNKGRYNAVRVNLGYNATGEVFSAEIRERPEQSSPLILTWFVDDTDLATGYVELQYDDSESDNAQINANTEGWMDLKRVEGDSDVTVFDEPLAVKLMGTVTA